MRTTALLLSILSILGLTLIFLWFKDGYILGTAESQIPFYDLGGFYNQTKLAWSDTNPGLGYANGIVTALAPTFFVLSFLQGVGIPNFIIEACLFWFFLVAAGLGITLFTQELFPKISRKYLLIASLFYWFNLISLVNIWNRFLYNYMAFWALLPLVAAFYLKGIKKQKLLYVFIVGTTCAIFSLGLSNPVFNIVLWLVFLYITIFNIFFTNIKKDKLFFVLYFFLNFIFFCLTNFWWIGQVVRNLFLGKYAQELSTFYKNTETLTTLNSLSTSLGDINYLFRLFHKSFFMTPFIDWAKLFVTPWAVILEFLTVGIILFFIIKKRKNINVLFLGTLFILSLYLAKGSNPPFGKLFELLFTRFTPLQFFRNPFEKFGFIIPLAATPLLVAGIEDLSLRFQKKGKTIIYIICLVIIAGLFGYPFWSGLVFTNTFPPTNDYSIGYKVKVPEYYPSANSWLNAQGQNFRFIGFPFSGQGVTYLWEKGYQGIETSTWLFSTPHIMYSTTTLYFNEVADQLEELFMKNKDFYKVMNVLNAKYLMVRSDIDFHERNMRNPDKVSQIADRYTEENQLKASEDFGKLKFWENSFWSDRTIYASVNLIKVSPQVKLSDFILPEAGFENVAYQNNLSYLFKMTDMEIVHPQTQKDKGNSNPPLYEFDIRNAGSYELVSNLPVVRIDKKRLDNKPVLREDGQYSFGSFNLEKGLHEMEVLTEGQDNLAVQNTDINNYTISDFDPFAEYEISFDYSVTEDKKKRLTVTQDNEQIRNNQLVPFYIRDLGPASLNSLNSYKDILEPRNTASSLRIYFSPKPSSDIIIRNMSINKIINPSLALIRKVETNFQKKPELTYTKISPTQYVIHIKNSQNPFSLVYSSTFNTGWEIIYPDGTKAKKHFLANSFANGWLIERVGEYDLTLNYILQDGLNIDSLVSLISSATGALIILTALIFRKLH